MSDDTQLRDQLEQLLREKLGLIGQLDKVIAESRERDVAPCDFEQGELEAVIAVVDEIKAIMGIDDLKAFLGTDLPDGWVWDGNYLYPPTQPDKGAQYVAHIGKDDVLLFDTCHHYPSEALREPAATIPLAENHEATRRAAWRELCRRGWHRLKPDGTVELPLIRWNATGEMIAWEGYTCRFPLGDDSRLIITPYNDKTWRLERFRDSTCLYRRYGIPDEELQVALDYLQGEMRQEWDNLGKALGL